MLKICLRYAQGIIPPSYPIKPNIIEGNKNHNMYKNQINFFQRLAFEPAVGRRKS